MVIIFLIISILLSIIMIYIIGRSLNTHQELISAYKTSDFLGIIHLGLGVLLALTFLILLTALNNTFWHLTS